MPITLLHDLKFAYPNLTYANLMPLDWPKSPYHSFPISIFLFKKLSSYQTITLNFTSYHFSLLYPIILNRIQG